MLFFISTLVALTRKTGHNHMDDAVIELTVEWLEKYFCRSGRTTDTPLPPLCVFREAADNGM